MLSVSEIEQRISALKTRYAELDERLVPKGDGIIDGTVSSAMGAVTAEIARLEGMREKALVADLLEIDMPVQKQAVRAPSTLPKPVYATPDNSLGDPLPDTDPLPDDEEHCKEIFTKLFAWSIERINADLRRREEGIARNIPIQFTQGLFQSLIMMLAEIQAEARWGLALGRDRRNDAQAKLLKRIEALEARPRMQYRGIWDENEQYNTGDFLTCGGSLYYCKRSSRQKPPSDDHQLAAKRGRDGRDLR